MEIKILKLNSAAILPIYAHPGDTGLDLFSVETIEILPGETQLVKTGIAIALPPNTEAQIRPRSGLALKHSVTVLNSPGTIDAGYRGEIGIILINHGKKSFHIVPGSKIAQMVYCRFQENSSLFCYSRICQISVFLTDLLCLNRHSS